MLLLQNNVVLYFCYISPKYSLIYEPNKCDGIKILNDKITSIKPDFPNVSFIMAGDLCDFIPDDYIDNIYNSNEEYPGYRSIPLVIL